MARSLFPRSVRSRTAVLATALVSVALVAVVWALLEVLEASLVSSRDDLSRARLETLLAQARDDRLPRVVTDVGEDGMGQAVAADGRVLAASDGLIGSPPVSDQAPPFDAPTVLDLHGVRDDDETEDYRVWAQSTRTSGDPVAAYVGASPESVQEATDDLRRALLIGAPLVLLVVAAGTRLVVGRALGPVEDLRRDVGFITENELARRVPVPPTGDEVARLARTMNEMLARLEAAGVRQRELVGDASHELKTPLTVLRTQLEVALAHPRTTAWEPLAVELLDEVMRMDELVRDLLHLALEDAGTTPLERTLVDLDEVVLTEVARARARLDGRAIVVDLTQVSAGPVRGSQEDLGRAVRNLLENAVDHAVSAVEVRLESDERSVTLAVADDGPGIPDEHRERVFERFARVEPGRTRSAVVTAGGSGTGLGLAIVRGVVRRHGGEVQVDRSPDLGGAAFVVRLPLAD